MKLHFLGTRSAYPTTKKAASALAIQHEDGQVWLIDCGEGTQVQFQKVNVSRQKLSKIFITHLHGDHMYGLPGLLCSISMSRSDTDNDSVVEIYGPKGLSRFIYTALSISHALLSFQYRVHEIEPITEQFNADYDTTIDHSPFDRLHPSQLEGPLIQPHKNPDQHVYWPIFKDGSFEVKAGWINHGVPSYGFYIVENDKSGTLNVGLLKELGVKPGPDYGKLKNGETIVSPSGQEISPERVLGPAIQGRKVVILGDTCDATNFLPFIKSCDVLVHEATHDDTLLEKAVQFGHSTPSMAANISKKLGAKTLLLNHFSHRYTEEGEGEEGIQLLHKQAVDALENTTTEVICTDDLYCHHIKRPAREL